MTLPVILSHQETHTELMNRRNPMINAVNNKPYSATVQLTLHVAGQDYELAQVGPDRIFLRQPIDLPPCAGTLSINIDGQTTQHAIRLPEGSSAQSPSALTQR